LGLFIRESAIPIDPAVAKASEVLGIDPLQSANEGKLVAVISQNRVDEALRFLEHLHIAKGAMIIGHVVNEFHGKVILETNIGGSRILSEPSGELLPRIC